MEIERLSRAVVAAIQHPRNQDRITHELVAHRLYALCRLDRRLPGGDMLASEFNAWQRRQSNERRCVDWTVSRQDAD